MRRLHILLTSILLILVLLSVNRLTGFTLVYLPPNEFLRLVDFIALIPITLITIVLYFLLKRDIEESGSAKSTTTPQQLLWLNIVFIFGVGVYAMSSGDHETANYLNIRFCSDDQPSTQLCEIIGYHDDIFSHLLYYAGNMLLTFTILLSETMYPRLRKASRNDMILLSINASLIAAGIFINIAREPTAIDLVAFSTLALLACGLLWRGSKRIGVKRLPVTFYMALAYGLGTVSSLLYKLIS